jgi:hypothetical protein
MPNPLENNMLLYYLSGAGRAIGGQGSFADVLGGMTQQHIAAQSQAKTQQGYIKMLSNLLGGGAKITMDRDNMNIKAPTSAFKSGEGERMSMGSQMGMNQSVQQPTTNMMSNFLNPSDSQPVISSADLVGLGPQEVSQALGGALNVEQLLQSKISDVASRNLKSRELDILEGYRTGSLGIEGYKAETARMTAGETADTKNYKFAQSQGYKGNFEEFRRDLKTTHQKDYEYYVAQEKAAGRAPETFNDWVYKIAKAGGINLGELVARREAFAEVDDRALVKDPNFYNNVKSDLMKDDATWFNYDAVDKTAKRYNLSYETARDLYQQSLIIKEIDSRIRQAYGEKNVEYRKLDGWYVDGKLIRRHPNAK